MSFRSASSGETGRLAMGGSLTIENAARIREELIRAFRESDRVVLEIGEDVVAADVSFMQILCSAYRTAFNEKKTFEVDWSAAPGVRLLLTATGYNGDEQCLHKAGEDRRAARGGPNG
jgi:hypothetical protein